MLSHVLSYYLFNFVSNGMLLLFLYCMFFSFTLVVLLNLYVNVGSIAVDVARLLLILLYSKIVVP